MFRQLAILIGQQDEARAALAANSKPIKSRLIRANLTSDKSNRDRKNDRTSATPHPEGTPSTAGSPPADTYTNGRRGSVASTTSAAAHASKADPTAESAKTIRERTVALINIPDTVTDARIRSFLEPHGTVRKMTVRRDKEGCMVEFVNIEDAGRVAMGLDCSALGPEVRVVTVPEMLANRPGKKNAGVVMRPAQAGMSRPVQRGGRRGGLGFKRGGFAGAAKEKKEGDAEMGEGEGAGEKTNGDGESTAKSNDDFRAMFVKGVEAKKEE